MTKFLSDGWVDRLVAALNDSDNVRASVRDVSLTIHQIVKGAPDGDAGYWLTFDDGDVSGGAGEPSARPDVTITQDYETAAELSRGELNPQGAFMQGRLKVTGNMGKLLQNSVVIEGLGPVMSSIETEY